MKFTNYGKKRKVLAITNQPIDQSIKFAYFKHKTSYSAMETSKPSKGIYRHP